MCSCSSPFTCVLAVFVLSNINSIVDKAHFLVCSFMLECIAVILSKLHTEIDYFRCRIWDLYRIRFDVSNLETSTDYFILKCSHKQSSTKSNNVILISNITERVREISSSKTIYRIDCYFQCLCKVFSCTLIVQIWSKLTIKHRSSFIKLFVLNVNSCIQNIFEVLSVFSETIHCNNRMRMQASNIKKSYIRIHSRFSINISAQSKIGATIHVFAILEFISRKCLYYIRNERMVCAFASSKISVYKLRMFLFTKYNSGSKRISCVVSCHAC